LSQLLEENAHNMLQQLTTKIFIQRAREKHGEKYNYSKVEYINNHTKVCIICKEHGEFWQQIDHHLAGQGCPKCAQQQSSKEQQGTGGNRKPNGYWTKERVIEEAHKYSYLRDFSKNSAGAFNSAVKHKWLHELTWLQNGRQRAQDKRKLWNHETCYKEALKYKTLYNFRKKSSGAYTIALRNHWLFEYTWLKRRVNEVWNKKWNYETCHEEALKYNSRSSFGKGSPGAYNIARLNRWLDDWFPNLTKQGAKVDSVYRYFYKDYNTIYVGRTLMYRQHIRDIEHRWIEGDRVLQFAKEHQIDVPPMEILEDNLTIEEGKIREDYWRKYYEASGANMLNIGATGKDSSSVGALDHGKWDFEKVYALAKGYNSIAEFNAAYGYLYKLAKAKGWIDKFDWFRGEEIRIEKQTKWTQETCRIEAHKFTTSKAFRANCRGAYEKAKENGWLEEYTWLDRPVRIVWNKENCQEEASKYSSRFEFQQKAYTAYKYALTHHLLDDFFPQSTRKLDFETCKQLASKYTSIKELIAADYSLYYHSKKKGYLKDFLWLKNDIQKHNYWNKDTCFEEAKKYKSKSQFQKNGKGAYVVALQNHWLEDYTWFNKQFEWTYELCKQEALKYPSTTEFRKAQPVAHQKAYRKGWLDEFFPK